MQSMWLSVCGWLALASCLSVVRCVFECVPAGSPEETSLFCRTPSWPDSSAWSSLNATIVSLHFTTRVSGNTTLPEHSTLRSLTVAVHNLDRLDAAVFASQRQLRQLSLTGRPTALQINRRTFAGIVGLRDLRFDHVDVSITPDLDELPAVKKIIAIKTSLRQLPRLNRSATLVELNVTHCHVTTVNDELIDLEALETLDLSHNDITLIKPNAFGGLVNLSRLILSNNLVESLPDLSDLGNVETMRLEYNKLQTLPDLSALRKLRVLHVFQNRLTQLADRFVSGMFSVKVIILHSNRLTRIGHSTFAESSHIIQIDLKSNAIEWIDERALDGLRYLRVLLLGGNQLATLTERTFHHQQNLTLLDMFDNPLNCNCSLSWLSNWIFRLQNFNATTCKVSQGVSSSLRDGLANLMPCSHPMTISTTARVTVVSLLVCSAVLIVAVTILALYCHHHRSSWSVDKTVESSQNQKGFQADDLIFMTRSQQPKFMVANNRFAYDNAAMKEETRIRELNVGNDDAPDNYELNKIQANKAKEKLDGNKNHVTRQKGAKEYDDADSTTDDRPTDLPDSIDTGYVDDVATNGQAKSLEFDGKETETTDMTKVLGSFDDIYRQSLIT